MNNLKDIDANELATIRIALLDKIDKIKDCIKLSYELDQLSEAKFWEISLDKHTTLLNKLY